MLDAAPEVDISALVLAKNITEMNKFANETHIETNKNHLTGFLQDAELDISRFNEQRVLFDNSGQALNPTDGSGITTSIYVGN